MLLENQEALLSEEENDLLKEVINILSSAEKNEQEGNIKF